MTDRARKAHVSLELFKAIGAERVLLHPRKGDFLAHLKKQFEEIVALEKNPPRFVSFGDILFDVFVEDGQQTKALAGGASYNVAVLLAQMKADVLFVGCVGMDDRGQALMKKTESLGIPLAGLSYLPAEQTAHATVQMGTDGSHAFSEIDLAAMSAINRELVLVYQRLIERSEIVLLSTLPMMTGRPTEAAAETLIQLAQKNDRTIFFDPNLRSSVWQQVHGDRGLEEMKEKAARGLEVAHIVKMNLAELLFLTGFSSGIVACEAEEKRINEDDSAVADQINRIAAEYDDAPWKILLVTRGPSGISYLSRGAVSGRTPGHVPSPPCVRRVDTVGCGDAVNAALMFAGFTKERLDELERSGIEARLRFAVDVAAKVAGNAGAILPAEALEELTQKHTAVLQLAGIRAAR